MNHGVKLIALFVLLVLSCKKSENVEIRLFIQNNTNDTLNVNLKKGKINDSYILSPDTVVWICSGNYCSFTPSKLLNNLYDSVLIYNGDTQIVYTENNLLTENPLIYDSSWYFIESSDVVLSSLTKRYITYYDYGFKLKE